jgi:hypothetical protein
MIFICLCAVGVSPSTPLKNFFWFLCSTCVLVKRNDVFELHIDQFCFFFSKRGSPSLCIKIIHTAFFYFLFQLRWILLELTFYLVEFLQES